MHPKKRVLGVGDPTQQPRFQVALLHVRAACEAARVGAILRDTPVDIDANTAAALRDTARRLDAVLDNTRMAVFLMDHRQHCVYANAAAEQLTGYHFAEMQGRPLHDVIHHKHADGRDYPLEDCPIDRAFPEDYQVEGEETFVHKDGSFYPVAFTASPIRDEASQTIGTVIEVRGVAGEKARDAALHESREALKAERDRLYALFEHAPGLVAVAHGSDHVFALANQAYRNLVGERELIGRPVREVLPELVEQGFVDLLDTVYRTGEPFVGHAMPTRVGRSDPEERFFDFVYQPIRESDGAVSGIFAQGFDVTERVLFMSRQKLLLDELNHRVKNNLATVQSVAYQTARHAPDLATFRKTFDSRLVALARTHDVLTAESWESADLRAVLEAELGPYGESRVRLDGPPLRLNPQQTLALGLVIHELATNAAKYGALSGENGGCVRVSWSDGDNRLRLVWNETDGPPVLPPERRGFGSRLIERGVQELGGEVTKEWRPGGLDCRITIPL